MWNDANHDQTLILVSLTTTREAVVKRSGRTRGAPSTVRCGDILSALAHGMLFCGVVIFPLTAVRMLRWILTMVESCFMFKSLVVLSSREMGPYARVFARAEPK